MSFKSILHLDGEEQYKIISCEYAFDQATDSAEKPQSFPKGGEIKLVIERPDDNKRIIDWILNENNETKMKDGSIFFVNAIDNSILFKVEFKKAYCIDFKEEFVSDTTQPMKTLITIISGEITVGDTKYSSPLFK